MTVSLVKERAGSITIDASHVSHIDDVLPVLKAILMWMGFAMQTIDSIFDEELKKLEE